MPSASSASEALRRLAREIEQEARRAPFDVCAETYAAAGRDPAVPIVCAGALDAPVCCFGRELGREEVLEGQPLIGSGGRRLRRGVHETLIGPAPRSERRFDDVLPHVLLANMVPYRPVGNRAYARSTVDRFRPFVERLLGEVWTGARIVALGQSAFLWFAPYAADGAVAATWADGTLRFEATLPVDVLGRSLELRCVPHPSPLSPFKGQFAELLGRALRG